jgi:hypothetical protein
MKICKYNVQIRMRINMRCEVIIEIIIKKTINITRTVSSKLKPHGTKIKHFINNF